MNDSPLSSPDQAVLAEFLTALFPVIRPHWLLFWGLPSKRSVLVQDMTSETLADILAWAQVENVHVGVGLRDENYGPYQRGDGDAVTGIPGLCVDIDIRHEVHKKRNLPPSQEDAMKLLKEMGLPPTIIVHTGHGLQAWWLFEEFWQFDVDGDDREKAEALMKAWNRTLRARAHWRGWDVDQVGDLPRVMRPPGTWNRKADPCPVRIISFDKDRRYQPSDFEHYLLVDVAVQTAPSPHTHWDFTLDPLANPPVEKFEPLLDAEPRFRRSWGHTRKDLKDTSLSGYDMSLARLAYLKNWTTQEIVNLLIAHRRKYGDEVKLLRRDYFVRMLNRLVEEKQIEETERILEQFNEQQGQASTLMGDRSEVLDLINRTLFPNGAHRIRTILKYTGEPNTYVLDLSGRKVDIGPIEHLTAQSKFRNIIADATCIWPRLPSKKAWDPFVQHMLSTAELVETGREATDLGTFEDRLDRFLSQEVAREEEWEEGLHAGAPFRHQGQTCFTRDALKDHLWFTYRYFVSESKLPVFLRRLGYVSKDIKYRPQDDKSRSATQCVWYKP
jgi:hypothetical protein